VNGLLLPLPLSSELLYSRAGTSIETVVLLIEAAMYKAETLLHSFLEGYHPFRVWYCEVAIIIQGLELSFKVPFITEIVVFPTIEVAVYKSWNIPFWFP